MGGPVHGAPARHSAPRLNRQRRRGSAHRGTVAHRGQGRLGAPCRTRPRNWSSLDFSLSAF